MSDFVFRHMLDFATTGLRARAEFGQSCGTHRPNLGQVQSSSSPKQMVGVEGNTHIISGRVGQHTRPLVGQKRRAISVNRACLVWM